MVDVHACLTVTCGPWSHCESFVEKHDCYRRAFESMGVWMDLELEGYEDAVIHLEVDFE